MWPVLYLVHSFFHQAMKLLLHQAIPPFFIIVMILYSETVLFFHGFCPTLYIFCACMLNKVTSWVQTLLTFGAMLHKQIQRLDNVPTHLKYVFALLILSVDNENISTLISFILFCFVRCEQGLNLRRDFKSNASTSRPSQLHHTEGIK